MESIVDRLAEKQRRFALLRDAHGKTYEDAQKAEDVELTYTSNAIEGNTLTRAETAEILEKGITVAGKPLKDHLEALGHRDALEYVRGMASSGEPIREGDIRSIHRLVIGRVLPEEAGRYSARQRIITGSTNLPPSPIEVPSLMAALAEKLKAASASPEVAFEAHYELARIHPFSDGNGRTARLLMNLILLRAAYPPVVIPPERRVEYITGIQERIERNEALGYRSLMFGLLEQSLARYIMFFERERNMSTEHKQGRGGLER